MDAKKRLLAERGLTRWEDWQGVDKPALYALVQQTCTDWLGKRGERAGFSLDKASCVVSAYQQLGNSAKRGGTGELQFSTVDFDGALTVEDPVAFQETLFHGIGTAKAFGCGLLLVRRNF
jgi:CRISPR system Cascade subunit CasE